MLARLTRSLSWMLAVVFAVPPAFAQQLEPGARVRIHADGGRFDGRLVWANPDSLAIGWRKDTLVYSRADIKRLDVAIGTRRHTLQGLGIGAGIGAAAAAAIVLAYDDDGDTSYLEGLEYVAAGGILLGGAALGALTGTLIKSPRWTRIRPQGLGVRISF